MAVESIKKDGGYYFPDVDIHVVADTKKEAIALIEQYHGINVEKYAAEKQADGRASTETTEAK